MRTVFYKISSNIEKKLRIVLLSDLHDREYCGLAERVSQLAPDMIAIPGDLTSRLDLLDGEYATTDRVTVAHRGAFSLLTKLSAIAPTYYSLGNHELCGHYYKQNFGALVRSENLALIKESGAVLLDDSSTVRDGIEIAGLTSGHTSPSLEPRLEWLCEITPKARFSVLLCHHPEYYEKYLKSSRFDLILSGHAHGGQIRLFGRGLYAPGQGILPRYDGGVYDGRLVVGRGLANTAFVPRFFNPKEIVVIDVSPN